MAGKATVFASRSVFYAMDELSKNTLIDFVTDLAHAEVGEDASDETILAWVERKIKATHRARSQKSVSLLGRLARVHANDQRYLQTQKEWPKCQ